MKFRNAETFEVNGKTFVVHLYSASQALDVISDLSPILGAAADSEDIPDFPDLSESPTSGVTSRILREVRAAGGTDLVIRLLSQTYYEDQPIDSRARFDAVFPGVSGLVDAAKVLYHTLRIQFRPLLDALPGDLLRGLTNLTGTQS